MILCHIGPPLGIQHDTYSQYALIKLLDDGSPLNNDLESVVISEVPASGLISPKTGVVVYKLSILLICGGTGLSNRLTRAWPVSGGVVTLYVLHHHLWLKIGVLSLL